MAPPCSRRIERYLLDGQLYRVLGRLLILLHGHRAARAGSNRPKEFQI